MLKKALLLMLVVGKILAIAMPAFADQPPGQKGYKGQPGNQSKGQNGYEGNLVIKAMVKMVKKGNPVIKVGIS